MKIEVYLPVPERKTLVKWAFCRLAEQRFYIVTVFCMYVRNKSPGNQS
jgi:hypothetical protein